MNQTMKTLIVIGVLVLLIGIISWAVSFFGQSTDNQYDMADVEDGNLSYVINLQTNEQMTLVTYPDGRHASIVLGSRTIPLTDIVSNGDSMSYTSEHVSVMIENDMVSVIEDGEEIFSGIKKDALSGEKKAYRNIETEESMYVTYVNGGNIVLVQKDNMSDTILHVLSDGKGYANKVSGVQLMVEGEEATLSKGDTTIFSGVFIQ